MFASSSIIILNVLSAVTIVTVNKFLLTRWPFFLCLSFIHSLLTLLSSQVLILFQCVDTPVDVPAFLVAEVAGWGLASVTLSNVNLRANSIGVYQASKLSVLPLTNLFEYCIYGRTLSCYVNTSLVLIMTGVTFSLPVDIYESLFKSTDSYSFSSLLFAILSAVTSAIAVIRLGEVQKCSGVSSVDLLDAQQRYVIVYGAVLAGLFEDSQKAVYSLRVDPRNIALALMSGFLAVTINFTGFILIKKLSPLTFQVLNYLKILITLFLGVFIFNERFEARQIVGTFIALTSMASYTFFRQSAEEISFIYEMFVGTTRRIERYSTILLIIFMLLVGAYFTLNSLNTEYVFTVKSFPLVSQHFRTKANNTLVEQ